MLTSTRIRQAQIRLLDLRIERPWKVLCLSLPTNQKILIQDTTKKANQQPRRMSEDSLAVLGAAPLTARRRRRRESPRPRSWISRLCPGQTHLGISLDHDCRSGSGKANYETKPKKCRVFNEYHSLGGLAILGFGARCRSRVATVVSPSRIPLESFQRSPCAEAGWEWRAAG